MSSALAFPPRRQSPVFPDPPAPFDRKGQLDVRELISLYPLLLPSSSAFTRCHPPLHEFADLNHLAQGDQEKVRRCKLFLVSYLREARSTEVANGCREDVDTALLKLYAEADHESLLDLLASENACLLADSAPWLEKHHKWVLRLAGGFGGDVGQLTLWFFFSFFHSLLGSLIV